MDLIEVTGTRNTDISQKILNKWINDEKEKAKFTPVVKRDSRKDIFTYLYKIVVKIQCLNNEFCGQESAAVLIVPVRAGSSFGVQTVPRLHWRNTSDLQLFVRRLLFFL